MIQLIHKYVKKKLHKILHYVTVVRTYTSQIIAMHWGIKF